MSTLLPPDWVEHSIDAYLYQHSTNSQKIYWVVLIAVVAALISLPFVYVDISIQGGGVIRPVAEKTEIKAPITELVDSVFVREGATVKKGDPILKFRTNGSDYKISYQTNRLNDYQAHIADLTFLAKGKCPNSFSSPMRQQQYSYYNNRLKEIQTTLNQAEIDYNRHKKLFDKLVISQEEYEKYYFQHENQKNELQSFIESQLSTWQADLNSYKNSSQETHTSLKQEIQDKDLYIVRSPVTGTLDQFAGIYRGSSIQAGQSLAVISPDSIMYFEVYVTPRDIGYLSLGMPVQVQVESFNYNEWGTIKGTVKEISSDFLTDNQGASYYKVKCDMEKEYLTLRNGRKGKLKKGMTISAHFMVTRRSLFDLLYQKMDDWVNPAQYKHEQTASK